MKFTKAFGTFLTAEVNLDQERLDRLQAEVEGLENFLSDHGVIGEIFVALIPAGSWSHRTIIRPVKSHDGFDADVLLLVREQGDWAAKDYIQKVYEALRGSNTYRNLANRMTRCVRINFPDDFHIDIVPFMERTDLTYITNRTDPPETGSFELSNPVRFTEWLEDRHRWTGGDFVKVVRLLKYLRDFKDTFSCKSVILTTLLGAEVNEIEASLNPDLFKDVPTSFVTILGKLANSLPETMPAVLDPGETGDNFTDRYKDDWAYENFRKWITYYADKADRALKSTNREESIGLWREIFGDEFHSQALETKAAAVVATATYNASREAAGERFIDQAPFGFVPARALGAKVRVTGRCLGLATGTWTRRNGFRQFNLSSHGNQVPKNRKIQFTATVTGVDGHYDLYWKVRNGGHEAASLGALRGEISRDEGQGIRTETTSYKGAHYVDCYVVQRGRVLASDRQLVIVT